MMSTASPIIDMTSYGSQWWPNITNDENYAHTRNTMADHNTHCFIDKSITNQYLPISSLCVDIIDCNEINDDLYFSITNAMDDIDLSNPNNELEKELREKITKHKKSSNFGFSALQKRIERVKNDLLNLTNKLNSSHAEKTENEVEKANHCYYNITIDDNDAEFLNENVNNNEMATEKSWKCPSQFSTKNSFSELSENTQKILGRLNLKEDDSCTNGDLLDNENEGIEMEEDELDFTFSNRQNSLLNTFMSKLTLPVIEEQDEEDSSSDDESESVKSTVIERLALSSGQETIKSVSMHSFDVTDSDSYATPLSSFRLGENKSGSTDDTDEYFSDFAKCSVSSYSSRESLKSQDVDRLEMTSTENTIKVELNYDQVSESGSSLLNKSTSSLKGEEDMASDEEYDHSAWSNDDVQVSTEQSDSVYQSPYRSILKSSLENLLDPKRNTKEDVMGGSLTTRQYNKSTDLDEILSQLSPYQQSTEGRLSQSLCNLFSIRSNQVIHPDDLLQEGSSFDNLLETDLDSGYMSIYKPVKETEIISKVDYSCSMSNVNELEGSFNGFPVLLIDRLRKKASSVSELRIADSLSKLNIPNWLNFHDEESDDPCGLDFHNSSMAAKYPSTNVEENPPCILSKTKTTPRNLEDDRNATSLKPRLNSPVVLPSQLLRQSSQRKLAPIKFCRARQLLSSK